MLAYASLRFLPRVARVLIFAGLGIGFVGYGIVRLNRSILRPFVRPGHAVVDELTNFHLPRTWTAYRHNRRRAWTFHASARTESLYQQINCDRDCRGRWRVVGAACAKAFGILPPGDIRNCLAALSNDEQMLTQLFKYRFSGAGELDGHSFGNLFITALADITGSFESAIAESGKVLSVSGRVLPSTLHDVRLVADMELPNSLNQVRVQGESRIPKMAGRVRRVWLEPNDAPAFPPTLKAVLNADLIVVGPGSLYTSLLPNLLVPDLLGAIHASRGIESICV